MMLIDPDKIANSTKSHFLGILSVMKCSRAERKNRHIKSKDNIFVVKGIKAFDEELSNIEQQVINSASITELPRIAKDNICQVLPKMIIIWVGDEDIKKINSKHNKNNHTLKFGAKGFG